MVDGWVLWPGSGAWRSPGRGGAKRRNLAWRSIRPRSRVAEAHDRIAGLELGDAEQLADQSRADEDLPALPLDLAGAVHATGLVIGVVPGVRDALRHGTRRSRIVTQMSPRPRMVHDILGIRLTLRLAHGVPRSHGPAERMVNVHSLMFR